MVQSGESQAQGTEVVARFPCSEMQRQFWFLDQLNPGDPSLNVAMRWEIDGRLQDSSIERALQAVVMRHEILRTRFVDAGEFPEQEVMARVEFRPSHIDLRTTPEAERPARITEIVEAEAAQPFDLTRPGLLRAVIIRGAPDHVTVLVVVHHTVFDGQSISILARDFGQYAEAFELGRSPELPELPLQYGDFTLWQQEYLASGAEEEDRAYWAEAMAGVEHFELEPDKPRPARRSHAIARMHGSLPEGFDAKLAAATRAAGVSPFAFGAAVVSGSLARATGRGDVVFNIPVVDRPDPDLETLVGPFVVAQALRLQTDPEARFGPHLARVREVIEGNLAHRNLQFSTLVEIVNPPRDASRAPITSVTLNFMRIFTRPQQYGPFRLAPAPAFNPGAAQDLHILFLERSDGWHLTIEYCPDLYERSTIEGLIETITDGFEAVFADGNLRLGTLPLAAALARRGETERRGLKRIEQILSAHPDVGSAAAVATDGGSYAFVSPAGIGLAPLESLPARLMQHLVRQMPAADRPLGISILSELPRTVGGDIDRARLPAPPARTAPPESAPGPAEIDTRLKAIWCELLGLSDLRGDQNFFDLGGHSLLAVRLVARVRSAFGVSFGVAALYAAPTFDGMAREIRTQVAPEDAEPGAAVEADEDWQVVPLQEGGSGAPLIAINDVGLILATLGRMAEARPAVCVRLFDGKRGIDQSERTFEEIAAEYARVVRRVQPRGPYTFFGVCVHGNIALETARILQAEGEEITAVILKDVWEPGYVARMKANRRQRWMERLATLAIKLGMVRRGALSVSAFLGSYRLIRATGVLQLAQRLGLVDRVRRSDLTPEQEGFVAYISAARNRYRPKPFAAPVLHVVTRITPRGWGFAPSIGWEEVVIDRLKTVHIDDVAVRGGRQTGTEDLAREIEGFLQERALLRSAQSGSGRAP